MDLKKIKTGIISFFMVFSCICIAPLNVFAADASVVFGSDSYENETNEEFPVGLYIDGDSEIGFYHVEVSYDPQRLEYVEGASSGGDGTIIFEGSGNAEQVSVMLKFKALSGGNTELEISKAQVRVAGTDDEEFSIAELVKVPVVITGEDVAATTQTEEPTTESTAQPEDIQESSQSENVTAQNTDEGNASQKNTAVIAGIVAGLAGLLGLIIVILGVRGSKRRKKAERIERARNAAGNNLRAVKEAGKKELIPEAENKTKTVEDKVKKAPKTEPENKPAEKTKTEPRKTDSHGANSDTEDKSVIKPAEKTDNKDNSLKTTKPDNKNNTPVIDVRHVSMEFKVSNANTSGLKDYAIQKMKGKLKYRKLKALDDISFQVFKGEVVGIIGSNGSGKSTLLKIVSGALRPTSGEVITDKSKIQLLTFGAGFDGELSARENVYLNGAIIGYDKEFIDKHYDEIVEFSELKDFMEEKVKNFSSGMVSRLAFSIATVAGAAEILILDEVLAVGDQFFRKKSLQRVQEMIHGGSTVLIVSHSLNTIKTHCTKVVWIEKGILKMVGLPQVVCAEYSKSHGSQESDLQDDSTESGASGLVKKSDGTICYYKNGSFDSTYDKLLAFMPEDGLWYFVKEGMVDKSYSGLAQSTSGNWYYVKDGIFDKSHTGLERGNDRKWYYINHGKLDRSFSGMVKAPSGAWYYVRDGVYDSSYTGPAKTENGNWYYIENGKYNNEYNGKVEHEGKIVEVINGRLQLS